MNDNLLQKRIDWWKCRQDTITFDYPTWFERNQKRLSSSQNPMINYSSHPAHKGISEIIKQKQSEQRLNGNNEMCAKIIPVRITSMDRNRDISDSYIVVTDVAQDNAVHMIQSAVYSKFGCYGIIESLGHNKYLVLILR